ncbi:RCC1-like domain-containing protein [Plantactinospora sonchi]
MAAGSTHTLGLRADGTVVATGNNEHGQCDITGWDAIRSPN